MPAIRIPRSGDGQRSEAGRQADDSDAEVRGNKRRPHPASTARVTDNSGGALVSGRGGAHSPTFAERLHMLPLILILLLLAIVFGGFFVFSLKVAVVVAIVLLIAGAFGGFGYRGRRTI